MLRYSLFLYFSVIMCVCVCVYSSIPPIFFSFSFVSSFNFVFWFDILKIIRNKLHLFAINLFNIF